MTDIPIIEDMTFADTSGDETLSVFIENVDGGQVSVRYERNIVDNAGSRGVIYDVEDAGGDTFTEEQVQEMIANGTWTLVSTPAFPVNPDGDDA